MSECVLVRHEDPTSLDLIFTMHGPVGKATIRCRRAALEMLYVHRGMDTIDILARCVEMSIYSGVRTERT